MNDYTFNDVLLVARKEKLNKEETNSFFAGYVECCSFDHLMRDAVILVVASVIMDVLSKSFRGKK